MPPCAIKRSILMPLHMCHINLDHHLHQWWKRGSNLNMLSVNWHSSSIVLGAGFRVPDVLGLVALQSSDAPTQLFNVFHAAAHTTLVFGDDASGRVAEALRRVSVGVVPTVLLLPVGQPPMGVLTRFDWVPEDTAGHVYGGCSMWDGDQMVVIVRPDGAVGMVMDGAEGVKQYFQPILA
ncbi:hypothetical protein B0H10DRAFT_2217507 [Mycena sp. CBHHK59/15]|nr:hypothetical protein B0H10DRAFT_2217507 [Mycena sp. CBHHK59/15]